MTDLSFIWERFTKARYFWWIILTSTLPLLIMVFLAINVSRNALEQETLSSLSIIANNKVTTIENFIQIAKQNASLLAQNPIIIDSQNTANTQSQTQVNNVKATEKLRIFTQDFLDKTGLEYGDIVLLSPAGKIIFSNADTSVCSKVITFLNTFANSDVFRLDSK